MKGGARAPATHNWTRPAELVLQVRRLWERGVLLAAQVTGEALFPHRLALKVPTAAEVGDGFAAVRQWSSELRAMPHCRIEYRQFRHRQLGDNSLPHEAWLDSADAALHLIGKQNEAARFAQLCATTGQLQPLLLPWLAKKPLKTLELADEWPQLLAIVAWVQSHPRPNIYLRQVDIPGVHSKFIETHRGVLAEWLDLLLPPEAIAADASGVDQFGRRYGFRDKPVRIRFRPLDDTLPLCQIGTDMTLDAESFARLAPHLTPVTQVFITENEINFLAFPPVAGGIVIFGAGYGFEMLAEADWLRSRRLHYWGDLDTHGFAILDQLRSHLPHAESLLMDRATLLAHRQLWGTEPEDCRVVRDLPRLTPAEQQLYNDLRDNRLHRNLRLEQERVSFAWLIAALAERLRE